MVVILSKVLRGKAYGVFMKSFSVNCGLANLSSFRKVSFGESDKWLFISNLCKLFWNVAVVKR